MWRRGKSTHCWGKGKLVQPQWKRVWSILKKLKTELSWDPAKDVKSVISKRHTHPIFIEALFTTAKIGIPPKGPQTDE